MDGREETGLGRVAGQCRDVRPVATGAELFSAHARRQFGLSGFRQVRLDVYTAGSRAFSYTIFHIWRSTGDECRSLLYLAEPKILMGTGVLLVEVPARSDIEIWLRMRTAAKPVRVGHAHAGEFVLGTDFTYEDLRFWLPTDDFAVLGVASGEESEPAAWVVDVERKTARRCSRMRVHLDASLFLARKIEWFRSNEILAERTYEATRLMSIDGIWSATVMEVSRPCDGYLSVMTLLRASHQLRLNENLLCPEYLPRVDAKLLMGIASGLEEIPVQHAPAR